MQPGSKSKRQGAVTEEIEKEIHVLLGICVKEFRGEQGEVALLELQQQAGGGSSGSRPVGIRPTSNQGKAAQAFGTAA